jgi:apolipoprotein N-acyltransferase
MSQRHAADVVALVFGTIFAGFTVLWVLWLARDLHDDGAWWAGPLVLVVAGVAGLAAALRPSRYDEPGQQDDPAAGES